VGAVLLVGLIAFDKVRARRSGAPAATTAAGQTTIYTVDAWLDSCLGGCRRTAARRLANLSAEKRERYCTVNCECGLEKMTEPGPAPGQVRAPSTHWRNLNEDQQAQAAADCQKRTTAAVGQ
jgi:hypothetical protein